MSYKTTKTIMILIALKNLLGFFSNLRMLQNNDYMQNYIQLSTNMTWVVNAFFLFVAIALVLLVGFEKKLKSNHFKVFSFVVIGLDLIFILIGVIISIGTGMFSDMVGISVLIIISGLLALVDVLCMKSLYKL